MVVNGCLSLPMILFLASTDAEPLLITLKFAPAIYNPHMFFPSLYRTRGTRYTSTREREIDGERNWDLWAQIENRTDKGQTSREEYSRWITSSRDWERGDRRAHSIPLQRPWKTPTHERTNGWRQIIPTPVCRLDGEIITLPYAWTCTLVTLGARRWANLSSMMGKVCCSADWTAALCFSPSSSEWKMKTCAPLLYTTKCNSISCTWKEKTWGKGHPHDISETAEKQKYSSYPC